jgi:hypothetical protein
LYAPAEIAAGMLSGQKPFDQQRQCLWLIMVQHVSCVLNDFTPQLRNVLPAAVNF